MMEDANTHDREAEIALEDYRADIEEAANRMRYQVEYSQSALRNLTLVNGGAIVALLTLIGNSDAVYDERAMTFAFGWFSIGLGTSLLSYFGAFFSQFFFMNVTFAQAWNAQRRARGLLPNNNFQTDFRRGNIAMVAGIVLASVSAVAFVIGAFVALLGLAQ